MRILVYFVLLLRTWVAARNNTHSNESSKFLKTIFSKNADERKLKNISPFLLGVSIIYTAANGNIWGIFYILEWLFNSLGAFIPTLKNNFQKTINIPCFSNYVAVSYTPGDNKNYIVYLTCKQRIIQSSQIKRVISNIRIQKDKYWYMCPSNSRRWQKSTNMANNIDAYTKTQ